MPKHLSLFAFLPHKHELRPTTLHITKTSHTHKLQIYHIHAKQTNKQMPPIHKGKWSKTLIADFKVLYHLVPLQSPALLPHSKNTLPDMPLPGMGLQA